MPPRVEGAQGSDWLVVDCGGTVVHVRPHARLSKERRAMWRMLLQTLAVSGLIVFAGHQVVGHAQADCFALSVWG